MVFDFVAFTPAKKPDYVILVSAFAVAARKRYPVNIYIYIYGRCGYLYGLLFVNEQLGEGTIAKDFIKKVYTNLIDLGRELSTEEKSTCALMYRWYRSEQPDIPPFLDIAHGIAGILYMLLQVTDPDIRPLLDEFVKPTVDTLMEMEYKFPSGNYRVSLERAETDRDFLVHWCHGPPGMIYLFTLAYKFFGDEKYLTEAVSCSDVTWNRGLLRKGFTICHGIPGNALCFLPVWHASGDKKYLYRAYKYTCDFKKHACIGEEADMSPMALCCGLGGTLCFLVDMLEPGTAKFPAFEVQNKLNTTPFNTRL